MQVQIHVVVASVKRQRVAADAFTLFVGSEGPHLRSPSRGLDPAPSTRVVVKAPVGDGVREIHCLIISFLVISFDTLL